MSISKMLLPEFDHEMATTRKVLERIPDEKFSWKPHEKSMTLGGLATHLANIPSWTKNTFAVDELDVAPPGAPPYRLEEKRSRAEVLADFDKNGENNLHAAATSRHARFHYEPLNSSSRSTRRVSASAGCAGAVDLWPVGG